MAITIGVSATNVARSANTVATAGITTVSGSLLIAGFVTSGTFSSIVDNKSAGGWVQIQTELAGAGEVSRMYYKENATGGAGHTCTLTLSAADFASLFFLEIRGIATSSSIDQSDRRTDSVSPYTLAAGLTTTQADEILITMCGGSNGGTNTYAESGIGAAIQVQQNDGNNDWTGALAAVVKSATASYNPSWTNSASGDNMTWLATFKGATGGGGGKTSWGRSGLDGHSIEGIKQFNPSLS